MTNEEAFKRAEQNSKNWPEWVIPDDDIIHAYFGLSYASYLVIPRVVLQSMPKEWQDRFVKLMREVTDTLNAEWEPDGGYRVTALDGAGHFTKDPYANYEHGRRRLLVKDQPGEYERCNVCGRMVHEDDLDSHQVKHNTDPGPWKEEHGTKDI